MKKEKVSYLQSWLTVLFVTALLISNIVTGKQVLLPFGIVMTGGLFIFPVTYILSDVFSEVYGYRWSRVTCYMAFAMNLFMVLVFSLVLKANAPDYFENQAAFEIVLGNTPRILLASLCAYVCGDFANDKLFQKMKSKHPDTMKGFGWRAILSSLLGELVDSFIFLPLAFIGEMPMPVLFQMIVTEVLMKTGYEVLILPITTLITKQLLKYEKGIDNV